LEELRPVVSDVMKARVVLLMQDVMLFPVVAVAEGDKKL